MTNSGVIASGLLTSKMTSPVASSQNTADTTTSFGSSFATVNLVCSSGNLIEGSVLMTNLFFSVLDSDDKCNVSSVSANFGFLEYKAMFGPSNLAIDTWDSGGIDRSTVLATTPSLSLVNLVVK